MQKVKVCAHRGASGTHPENTLMAFKEAMRLGVDMIEFDVKKTKDNHLIVIHDGTVDRTTNGTGLIRDLPFSYIRSLDAGSWFNNCYSSEKIPMLDEVVDLVPKKIILNIHCYPDPEVTKGVISAVKMKNRLDNAFLAIESSQIPLARKLCPEIKICNLTRQEEAEGYLDFSIQQGCTIILFLNKNVTPELVKKAHDKGIKVNVFYANDEKEILRLCECGVDGLLTDYPERLLRLLGVEKN